MKNFSEREEILYAYSIEQTHDRKALEKYLRNYPELAEDLIDLSSEFRRSRDMGPSSLNSGSDQNWKAAFDEFLACGTEKEAQTVVNPFASFRGKDFVRLVKTLNVSHSFRTWRAVDTMERIAKALKCDVSEFLEELELAAK